MAVTIHEYRNAYKSLINKLSVERDYYHLERDQVQICALALEKTIAMEKNQAELRQKLEELRRMHPRQEENYVRDND